MGKRGPGAGRLKKAAALAVDTVQPWERDDMPPEEKVLAFLRELPIVSGLKAGEKLELLDFQEQFVRGVYAPVDDEGLRIVRLAALSVGRGNGKSQLLAGLGLAHLLGPMQEPYGEVYASALDREQAGVLYRMTVALIEHTPWMAARVNVKDWHKQIEDEESRSIWRALTSDARKAHGLAPSFWIADEVAQWKSRELWDNLATGMSKRAQALGVTISTQARDDMHFFSEMLDGPPVPSVYCQLHTADKDCAIDDPEAWKAANPALGEFLNADQFEDASKRALRSPSFAPAFKLLHLNQRVQAEGRFINAGDWDANAEPFDPLELEGKRCFGGLDLGSTSDLTAFSLWFPDEGALLSWHFVPLERIAERVEKDRVPYDVWASEGHIITPPGRATDRLAVAKVLAEVRQAYDVQAIAYDRWRIEELLKLLEDEGIDLPLESFGQGFVSMGPAVDAFETALLSGRMRHNGNPVLAWEAGNIVVDTDASGNRKPTKNRSFDKIDGIVAAIMACGISQKHEEPAEPWAIYLP